MNEFPQKPTLESLIEPGSPITYGVVKPGDNPSNGVLFIRGGDIKNGRIDQSCLRKISPEVSGQYSRTLLKGGELLISLVGNPGEVATVPMELCGANIARQVGLIRLSGRVNQEFVKYFFISPIGREALGAQSLGSVQVVINLRDLKNVKIPNFSRKVQDAIASILGSLDDKIDLNRRMNETLEAMARAIFKDWFVEFGPTRAKMEGRAPYLAPEIWELFPDRLDDEGKPEGWLTKKIEDLIDRLPVGRKYDQKTVEKSGTVPVFDQGKDGVIGYHSQSPGVVASLDSPVAVFANHTCYMRLVTHSFSTIQNVLPFKGKGVDTVWVYYASLGKQQFIEYKGHWPDFIINEVVSPGAALTVLFRGAVDPFVRRIVNNTEESRTIAQTRDLLLPKLMSGEIRVKDAEKAVESVI